jgi:hypothetical protein
MIFALPAYVPHTTQLIGTFARMRRQNGSCFIRACNPYSEFIRAKLVIYYEFQF